MLKNLLLLASILVFLGCGSKKEERTGESKNKIEQAVEQAVTKEFKAYEGAKKSIGKIEKEAQERTEKAKEVK